MLFNRRIVLVGLLLVGLACRAFADDATSPDDRPNAIPPYGYQQRQAPRPPARRVATQAPPQRPPSRQSSARLSDSLPRWLVGGTTQNASPPRRQPTAPPSRTAAAIRPTAPRVNTGVRLAQFSEEESMDDSTSDSKVETVESPSPSTTTTPPATVVPLSDIDEPQETFGPLAPDVPAETYTSGEWIRSGRWYTQQSVVYMNRSVNVKNSYQLATDFTSALNPHDRSFLQIPLSMGFQPGMKSTIGRFVGRDEMNRDHSIDFTFFGLNQWHSTAGLVAVQPGGIFSVIDPTLSVPAFNASDMQSFALSSNFNSYELNYRINRRPGRDRMIYTRDSDWVRQATPGPLPAIFAGIRFVQVNERLQYLASGTTGVPANGAFNIQTHNQLLGLQAGIDWYFERGDWRLGADQRWRLRELDQRAHLDVRHRLEWKSAHRQPRPGGGRRHAVVHRRSQLQRRLSNPPELRHSRVVRHDVDHRPVAGAKPDHFLASDDRPNLRQSLALLHGHHVRLRVGLLAATPPA